MERFENAIFKKQEEINDKMAEMFGLFKELMASRTLEKILMREEARHPITKNVNYISLVRVYEEENRENNGQIDKSAMKPGKSDEEEPPKGIDTKNKDERKAGDEPAKSARENVTNNEEDELAGVSGSHTERVPTGSISSHCQWRMFPLPGESSHWQYKFPLLVEDVPTARRMEIPLPGVCTAMMKKLPVKENWQLH
nr:hypothetical protein [Tanacetum cinerariifolium]